MDLDDYYVVLPAFKSLYRKFDYTYLNASPVGIEKPYNSRVETALSREELRKYLTNHHLLDIEV